MVLAGSGAAANGGDRATAVWTVAKARSYLRSIGVDPRSVVVQSGRRNYAGPRCPGKSWNCTRAKHVIQIGRTFQSVITNKFVCKGATGGTDATTNTCVVVQVGTTADNDARCFLTDVVTHESDVSQTCRITQTNGSGKNFAWAALDLRQYDSATENSTQHVSISQTNRTGNNDALATENIIQGSVFDAATLQQVQEAHQDVDVDQSSSTGTNSSDVQQTLNLRAVVFSGQGAISQSQNTADNGPNTLATVDQTSGSGANTSSLDQYDRLEAQATSKNGPVTQKQGSLTGGLRGEIHQDSSAPSTSTSHQDEDQIAHATTPPGTLTQVQIGPVYCCGVGSSTGNGSNSVTISETGHQESDGGSQTAADEAACRSSGTCATHQHRDDNTDSIDVDRSCQGSVESPCIVDQTVVCSPGEGCTSGPVEGGGGSPDSTLEKGVRDISREQTAFAANTFAFPGDTIEYQLIYRNTGTATAHSVSLRDLPPSAFTFASCTGGCTRSDTGTITWALGDVPAGESRTVTFRGTHSDQCGTTSNTASGFSKEEEGFSSNAATVDEACIG